MKKYLFILLFILMGGSLYAHPPSDIQATYDKDTGLLKLEVSHGVRNPDKHYIKTVTVFLDGEKVIEQQFKKQPDKKSQEAVYLMIDAKDAKILEVEAECSIYGKARKKYDIGSISGEPKNKE